MGKSEKQIEKDDYSVIKNPLTNRYVKTSGHTGFQTLQSYLEKIKESDETVYKKIIKLLRKCQSSS